MLDTWFVFGVRTKKKVARFLFAPRPAIAILTRKEHGALAFSGVFWIISARDRTICFKASAIQSLVLAESE